jgi:predicted SAM-dependent methyltransferase
MKLYLGSRDYCPAGYLTVDIDPAHHPDIVADVTDLANIDSSSVEEICASHVLEHIAWPLSFKALSEWARVLRPGGLLRLAVPDLGLLCRMIAEGRNAWWATGLIFGVGRIENPLEAHQYGYTRDMLLSLLRALGFGDFDWWKHDLSDASNGWMPDDAGGRVAISLNIAAIKRGWPIVPPDRLLQELMRDRLQPFDVLLARLASVQDTPPSSEAESDPIFVQRLHMALIEARMRILYLEKEPER